MWRYRIYANEIGKCKTETENCPGKPFGVTATTVSKENKENAEKEDS